MTVTSDEQTLLAAAALLGDRASTTGQRRSWRVPAWWPWAAALVAAVLVGVVAR